MMDALATLTTDTALAKRLKTAAAGAAAEVPVEQRIHAAVGHNRYPVAPLVLANRQPARRLELRRPVPWS